jgi:hypothetical protein
MYVKVNELWKNLWLWDSQKKRRKIQNGSFFKIITFFINCGEYAFLRFTTIWTFSFYYPAWMPSENDGDFGSVWFWFQILSEALECLSDLMRNENLQINNWLQ